ncbi:MAG: EAL domain-containing protein [Glaciecola sp.]
MTLSKQLGIGFLSVLLLVFVGTQLTNINNTQTFIQQQLSSHAQDTATSLGLSISPYIGDEQNLPIIETMTNAIFDRGYYLSITLTSTTGEVLLHKENPKAMNIVPAWFTNMFTIQAPQSVTEINDGWNIKGTLTIVSNPGFGYEQLYKNALSSFYVTLAVFALALLFVWLLVKKVISEPINNVISQTEAISQKHFEQITHIPKTKELKSFVVAINYMSNKLQTVFKQLSEQSEKYRSFAYTDPLTKVGNRRAFELSFFQMLRDESEQPAGHLLIIRASSLSEVHHALGGEIGDNYLVSVCDLAKRTAAEHFSHFAIYRIAGADFAIILDSSKADSIKTLAKALAVAFKRSEKSEHKLGMAHLGISEFSFGNSFKDVLEKCDSALAAATQNDKGWEIANSLAVSHSNETWRDKIQGLIKTGTSDFVAQPIMNNNQDVLYSEWFARLPNDKNSANLPMAQLIPASIRLDYAQDLDKLIITNLLFELNNVSGLVGLNVSRMSLFDAQFMQWFTTQLHNAGTNCTKLVLEIPERALVHDIDTLCAHMNTLKSMGVKIAVEHFGAQLAGITHIRKLQPDYLKIDGRFTRDIHNQIDNQLFLQSLISIASGLNISIIAEMVETEQERDWLLNAGINYVQGYYVGPPTAVESNKNS